MEDKSTIWLGGHVRQSTDDSNDDLTETPKSLNYILRRTVEREVNEELGNFPVRQDQISKDPKAIIWDNTKSRSSQHLAVFYEMTLPSLEARRRLHLREITETPAKTVLTQFVSDDDVLRQRVIEGLEELEPWSSIYLREVRGFTHIDAYNGNGRLF